MSNDEYEGMSRDEIHKLDRERRARRKAVEVAANLAEEKVYIEQIRELGYPATRLSVLPKEIGPLPVDVVDVLLEAVSNAKQPGVRLGSARVLGAASAPFDGTPLRQLYEDSGRDYHMLHVVLNTIVLAKCTGVDDWVADLKKSNASARVWLKAIQ